MFLANRMITLPGFLLLEVETSNLVVKRNGQGSFLSVQGQILPPLPSAKTIQHRVYLLDNSVAWTVFLITVP